MSKNLPSIFSVQRCLIISDAILFNRIPLGSGQFDESQPVSVVRHGILGTQNVAGKDKDVKNPQRTESAKTNPDASGLIVRFSLSTITLENAVFACNGKEFRNSINNFIKRFKTSRELAEVCNRYARNTLNGRWLWRNRILGQSIRVLVTTKVGGSEETLASDATQRPSSAFEGYSRAETRLGKLLMESLTVAPGQFNVKAEIDFGMTGCFEVFPSQNYVSDKPKGFARSLYKVNRISRKDLVRIMSKDDADTFSGDIVDMGDAAIRDQKVGNAIRTIDTWYEGDAEAAPIPVEPKGANIESNEVKRAQNDLFGMLSEIDNIHPAQEDGQLNRDAMFVMGNLVRGFLAGESDKDKPGRGNKKTSDAKTEATENEQ